MTSRLLVAAMMCVCVAVGLSVVTIRFYWGPDWPPTGIAAVVCGGVGVLCAFAALVRVIVGLD